MSITSASPDSSGVVCQAKFENGVVTKNYSINYFVKTSAVTDQSPEILDYFKRYGPWSGSTLNVAGKVDKSVECKSISPTREGPLAWRVAVTWAPPGQDESRPNKDGNGDSTDPLEWGDEVSVSFSKIQIPVYKAKHRGGLHGVADGKEMTPANSATVPFDPPLMKNIAVRIVRISKYTGGYDGAFYQQWVDVVNSDLVQIRKPAQLFTDTWNPFTAKIETFGGTFAIRNKVPHWKVDIEVHVHPISWREEVLDRGMHRRANPGDSDGIGGTFGQLLQTQVPVTRIRDKEGQPITEPVLLSGAGYPTSPTVGPVFITYQIYEERALNGAIQF